MANDLTNLISRYRAAEEALKVLAVECRQNSFNALAREADECEEIIRNRRDGFDFMLAKRSQKPHYDKPEASGTVEAEVRPNAN